MKRIEMITLIASEFVNKGMTSKKMSIVAAEEILSVIEKAGMIPPSFHTEDSGWSYYADGDVLWEPEDEEK